ELTGKDSAAAIADTTQYFTFRKRLVYGGGGIRPDVYVPYDTSKLTPGLINLLFSEDVKNTIWNYYLAQKAILRQYKTIKEYDKNFRADELVKNYIARLDPQMKRLTEKVMK